MAGEKLPQIAISYLTRQVRREWRSAQKPRIIASSSTKVIVEYSSDSMVIARGAVIAVNGKWQAEGLSQCSKRSVAR
jgi:hypothetical protein